MYCLSLCVHNLIFWFLLLVNLVHPHFVSYFHVSLFSVWFFPSYCFGNFLFISISFMTLMAKLTILIRTWIYISAHWNNFWMLTLFMLHEIALGFTNFLTHITSNLLYRSFWIITMKKPTKVVCKFTFPKQKFQQTFTLSWWCTFLCCINILFVWKVLVKKSQTWSVFEHGMSADFRLTSCFFWL